MRIKVCDTVLEIRKMRPRDEPYVMGTWLRSYASAAKNSGVSRDEYFRNQRLLCRELLPHVFVAVDEDDDETVQAWVCGERTRLHYLYVPPDLRMTDIGVQLVDAVCGDGPLDVTHKLPFMVRGWTYNPYAIGVIP